MALREERYTSEGKPDESPIWRGVIISLLLLLILVLGALTTFLAWRSLQASASQSAPRIGAPVTTTGILATPEGRREVWEQMIMAESLARRQRQGGSEASNIEQMLARVASHYGITQEDLLSVQLEGMSEGWASPGPGTRFLPPSSGSAAPATVAAAAPSPTATPASPSPASTSSTPVPATPSPSATPAGPRGRVETPEVPFGPSAVATPIVVAPPASTIAPGTQIDITQALPIAWRFIFRDPRADFKRRNETPIRARLIVRAVQDDRYLLDVAGMNGEFYHQGWISKSDLEQAIASGNARPVAP